MRNTVAGAGRTVAAALICVGMFSGSAAAEPSPLRAKVVWAHAGRVYIASADSLPLAEGDLLTFQADRKVLASAAVVAIHETTLAIARVESGSLDQVKKLDRLRVFAERRPIRPPLVLRVGLPARANLLFACEAATLRVPLAAAYRGDTLSERSFRFVRGSSSVDSAPWPDTLLIRLYDDFTDEEIAIERGELDVAVFWPGELSTRMRDDARWRDSPRGLRSHGGVVVFPTSDPTGFTSADSSAILSLNEEIFRGDLAPWDPDRAAPMSLVVTTSGQDSRRFGVARSCPGWETLERFLNRGKSPQPSAGEASPLHVMYNSMGPFTGDRAGFLFAIRCPVVCASNLRPYVRALGSDALADMLDCRPARRAP